MFLVKKLLSLLVLPPLAPLLPVIVGLVLWRRRLGYILAWTGIVTAFVLSTPAGVQPLLAPLENIAPPTPDTLKDIQAIVILAGGKLRQAPEYGGETVNRLSLERIRYGARLARQTRLPILVSGGAPSGGAPEALLMKYALEQDFGVRVRWVEDESLDTRENARKSAALLKPLGIERIALVSHAAHLQRARTEFIDAGFTVIPAPTGHLGAMGETPSRAGDFLPSPAAAYAAWFACHEWLGYWVLKFHRAFG